MTARPSVSPALCRQLLHSMKRLRAVEETIAARYSRQTMRCPVHLSTGQEAVSAGVGLVLRPTDLAVSGHRAHAHYIAKGGSIPRMLAEIHGKATGCSRGKGGSMHLIDESVGFKGSTAIVGGTIPVGTGLGLSIALRKTDDVAVVFFGDAAVEEGVFYEAANFAVLRRLPVLYVCENNLYSVYSLLEVRQPRGRAIHQLAAAIGRKTAHGDGNDPEEVHRLCDDAVASIRAGGGPVLLEFATYRWREHCGPHFDNDIGYRAESEYIAWKEKDPIGCFERRLITAGTITQTDLDELDADVVREVSEAFAFAEGSPFPEPDDAARDIYHGEAAQ